MTERRDEREEPAFFQMDPSERADSTRLLVAGRSGGSLLGGGAKGSNWLAMVFAVLCCLLFAVSCKSKREVRGKF